MPTPKDNNCIDCGHIIDRRSLRCKSCHMIHNRGNNHPSSFLTTTLVCPQCGGKKSRYAKIVNPVQIKIKQVKIVQCGWA